MTLELPTPPGESEVVRGDPRCQEAVAHGRNEAIHPEELQPRRIFGKGGDIPHVAHTVAQEECAHHHVGAHMGSGEVEQISDVLKVDWSGPVKKPDCPPCDSRLSQNPLVSPRERDSTVGSAYWSFDAQRSASDLVCCWIRNPRETPPQSHGCHGAGPACIELKSALVVGVSLSGFAAEDCWSITKSAVVAVLCWRCCLSETTLKNNQVSVKHDPCNTDGP